MPHLPNLEVKKKKMPETGSGVGNQEVEEQVCYSEAWRKISNKTNKGDANGNL